MTKTESLSDRLCCLTRRVLRILNRFPTSTTLSVDGVLYRTSDAWPLAADIPAGTGIVWWNTTTTTARTYINVAGALHYTAFDT